LAGRGFRDKSPDVWLLDYTLRAVAIWLASQ